jgi:outer membrane protein OmpA-like peptidoglycan-associated protein
MRGITVGTMAAVLSAALFALSAMAAKPALPGWFPLEGFFSVNPDELTDEDFNSAQFKVTNAAGDDFDNVEASGHHWQTSLYPPGPESGWDDWDGEAAWAKLEPALEKAGFRLVYLKQDPGNSVEATLRRESDKPAYVELFLSHDAHSNSVEIVEEAPPQRNLILTSPAATPESFGDKDDFPYLTPLAGATLLDTATDNGPLDVTAPGEEELHLVGSGTVTKQYEGPAGVSAVDFTTSYGAALRKAGWTVTDRGGGNGNGAVTAHYAANGRDIWAHLSLEGSDRWDVTVADIGQGLKSGIESGCKTELYGINFDFDKASLRPDAEPVLQQALAVLEAEPEVAVEIGGNTDNIGKPDYNLALSQRRAETVVQWLAAHGIAGDRLSAKGYGDTNPFVPNDSDADRARNRRVELKRAGCGQD